MQKPCSLGLEVTVPTTPRILLTRMNSITDIAENTVILLSRRTGVISDQMETVREGLKTVRNGEQFIGDESVASLEAEFVGCEQLFTEWKQIGETDRFRLTISDKPIHSVVKIGVFGQVLKQN